MKKQYKQLLSVILTFALLLAAISGYTSIKAAKKVKLSAKKITVTVGKSKVISVKNYKKKVKWSITSGKKYISMSNKKKTSVKIKGKKAGKATIYAKVGKKRLTCKVTIKKATATIPLKSPDPTQSPLQTPLPTQPAAHTPNPTSVSPSTTPSSIPSESPSESPVETETPAPLPSGYWYEGVDISWIDQSKPMIAFTFDDGPVGTSDTSTSMLIQNALKEYNAHATFFYIGSQINTSEKEDEIRMAKENGFEVGNHSWGWSGLNSSTEDKITKSIEDTNAKLEELTGYKNFLFRAPNLAISGTMTNCIQAPFINCSLSSDDWMDTTTTEQIIEKVKTAQDGDIILMHETQKTTAEAVPELLQYFSEKEPVKKTL